MTGLGLQRTPAPDGPPPAPADEAARVRLAARATTPARILRVLADDPAITVRAAVAMNPAFAPEADRQLLCDADDRVRALLGRKVAGLLPGLSPTQHADAHAHVQQTLLALADDAALRVRVAITEALDCMPEAPHAVILKLARDPAVAVSDPVIRLSPLLTDADLLDLLATPSHAGTAASVAGRPKLSAELAQEIADHADGAAVRALLGNPSACILESTLDALIGRAADHPDWHEPLVHRPCLPERAMRALSRMVASDLLDTLLTRSDVPPGLASELRNRVADQFDAPPPPASETEVLAHMERLNFAGALTEAYLLDAVAAGDHRQATAILAVSSGVPVAALDRAVTRRSAKALVSLAWKAGFTMRASVAVQSLLGQLSPGELLGAGPHGAFPLSADEMDWQIELLADPGR